MSKCKVLLLSTAMVVLFSSLAQGTLVSFSSDAVSSWSSSGAVISLGLSSTELARVMVTAESHSTFTVTSTVTNETSVTWTGYEVTLDPAEAAEFVSGSAGSTKFGTINEIDDWTLEFWAPLEVLPTQVVTLQFDVYIPDGGPYTFSLTQNPIPEPATVALLGLGTLALVMRRKHV